MLRSVRIISTLLVTAGLVSVSHVPVFAESDPLKEIKEAWQNREQAVESGDFRWVVKRTIHKMNAGKDPFAADQQDVPGLPIQQSYFVRVAFNRDRLRFESGAPTYFGPSSKFVDSKRQTTFDGTVVKSLRELHVPKAFTHQADIVGVAHAEGIRSELVLHPILRHFQPSKMPRNFFKDCTVLDDRELLNGNPCIVVRSKIAPNGFHDAYIDPQQGYSIRRIVHRVGERIFLQFDCGYRLDGDIWIPVSWREMEYDPSEALKRSTDATVKIAHVNEALNGDVFNLTFPAGTLFTYHWGPDNAESSYIVRETGPPRAVSPKELSSGKSPDEIINSEPDPGP